MTQLDFGQETHHLPPIPNFVRGTMLRKLMTTLSALSLLAFVYSQLGALHRSTDFVGLFVPILGIFTFVGAFTAQFPLVRFLHAVCGFCALFWVATFLLPQSDGGDVRLYSKNPGFGNSKVEDIQNDILGTNVDVVMLQEVSGANARLVTNLSARYPHQHFCQFTQWYAMAVLSRHPFTDDQKCSSRRALAAAQIKIKGKPVWVVSAHIPWPWPFENERNEIAAETLLAELEGPVVIAGDFNVFPWTQRFQRIKSITNTKNAGPTRPTLTYKGVPLPLNHVLAPMGGAVARRPLLGSDHRGVVADVGN